MGGRTASLGALLLLLLGAGPLRAQQAEVPVAARDLARGARLTAADIRMAAPKAARTGALAEPGWVTRRVVRAGEELRYPAVERPPLVRSGETVTVRWESGEVAMRLRGVVAGSAGRDERVWVRLGTGWRIEGVAVDSAVVVVQSPGRAQ